MAPNIQWPLTHNVIRRNSEANTFGMVRHNANGTKRPHQGWDFEAAIGTPCFAIADGKVALIKTGGDYGNTAVLSFTCDGATYYAAYAHLSVFEVKQGDAVTKGQKVGLTGNTGNASTMIGRDLHLHFEIRTEPAPGRGLAGRVSPLKIFREIPLDRAIDI
jgi:murein DD-endopeptidase MepM/ murein hydrolase activator NlpD